MSALRAMQVTQAWTKAVSALSLADLVKSKATAEGKTESNFSNEVTVTVEATHKKLMKKR